MSTLQWQQKARSLVQEGYETVCLGRNSLVFMSGSQSMVQHGDYAFKVATPSRWEIFICNEQLIKEYKNLMDDKFSANAVTADVSSPTW